MGTEIALDVGGIEVTYAKNHRGNDHGSLFQEQDRRSLKSDQLDYDYYEREEEHPTSAEMAFQRRLKDVVPRLELLGFTLDRVRREYEDIAENWRVEKRSLPHEHFGPLPEMISFPEFLRFAREHPLPGLYNALVSGFDIDSKNTNRGHTVDHAVASPLPIYEPDEFQANFERSLFGEFVDQLHPYSVTRLLAEGTGNDNATVVWQYGPLVEAGWATEGDFVSNARRTETFLIATEGSSDIHILKHALALLRPGIADFFRFIDVSEGHPFSGTGSLVKFAEGLAKIDVQNQVVFLFDNDAEGLGAHQRLTALTLPPNMRGVMLPEMEPFLAFPTKGPEGVGESNINRRAAAIECYLDLDVGQYPTAQVLWTNYKKALGVYQGSLKHKESYAKEFLKQTPETIALGSYATTKIEAVLHMLISECTTMALEQWQSAR